ncbi:MAG TPA: FAD-dependent oxidoreductase, partial [Candidatus Marinimicrobia bacterium]|nr:FAD-dependent oxidoreductase [Candidatus Neomarinimicrobiota bacterium]
MHSFDMIIYGASFQGIVLAKHYSEQGLSVALFHRYGFPGGMISTSFSVYQEIDFKLLDSDMLSARTLKQILSEEGGCLYRDDTHVIVNPEIYKMMLMAVLQKINGSILFYSVPVKVVQNESESIVSFILREGRRDYRCSRLIDASESGDVLRLIRPLEKTDHRVYNCFIKSRHEPRFQSFRKILPLTDGRWWASVNFYAAKDQDPSVVMHESLDDLYKEMILQDAVVQLIPMIPEQVFHITDDDTSLYRG